MRGPTRNDPVLVTAHLLHGLPDLRRNGTLARLRDALSVGADRFGFRLVEYPIQTHHPHRIFEAEDAHSIARGMQGLLVRVAKALNREWGRCGRVLVERDHARVRRAPRERFDPAAAGNRAGPCATVSPGGRSGPPSSGAR